MAGRVGLAIVAQLNTNVCLTLGASDEPPVPSSPAPSVGTLVGMHYSEGHRKRAEELKLNLVIAGHISSDVLGMNLILDKESAVMPIGSSPKCLHSQCVTAHSGHKPTSESGECLR